MNQQIFLAAAIFAGSCSRRMRTLSRAGPPSPALVETEDARLK